MNAMPFNLSETMILLIKVFSRLIAKDEQVPRIPRETFMLLKLLNGVRFNVLDILSGRQSLLSSQYVSHKSSFVFNPLGHGKSSLKRSANKLKFYSQLTFL